MIAWIVAVLVSSTPFEEASAEALSLAGLTHETARLDQNLLRFYDFDEMVLGSFSAYWESPWRIPTFVDISAQRFTTNSAKPSELLMAATWQIGSGTRRTLLGNPIAADEQEVARGPDLAGALASLDKVAGGDRPLESFRKGSETVPKEVAMAVCLLARVSERVLIARALTFQGIGGPRAAWQLLAEADEEQMSGLDRLLRLARTTELRYMTAAAIDLTIACEKAAEWLAAAPKVSFRYEVETALGWVSLRGSGRDNYDERPYFLIIDLSGDDTYVGVGGTVSADNGIALLFDLEGQDRYVSTSGLLSQTITETRDRKRAGVVPSQGGARCGVAVLFDLYGDDLYRSLSPGQGSAEYGVAILWDKAGGDTYEGYTRCQGFGQHGVGLLLDTSGNDRYTCFTRAQGCGLTRGFGLLVEGAGNDQYVADDTHIDFPSPQTSEHNVSMAQGSASGRRADYADGHSLGGGFGVLCDVAGNDRYSCGVFGQGVGYWKGTGILSDLGGDDQYSGVWYVQGASAHFAVGVLHDASGNDRYEATMNMAQGAGHDFSIGMLLDGAGNDAYRAPNLSLGAANANGIGVFLDSFGDDTYASSGATLGKANASTGGVREIALCLGVFLDLGGEDSYPEACPWAGNGRHEVSWTTRKPKTSESQLGIFLDRK